MRSPENAGAAVNCQLTPDAYFGTSPGLGASFDGAGVLLGTGAGVDAGGWPGAGASDFGMLPITPCCITSFAGPCIEPRYVRPRLETKKTAARTAVVRDRKFAEPD